MSPTDQQSFDLDEIVLRAKNLKQGTVSPAELEFARKALQSREGSIVAAIWIVGLCGSENDAPILERYLHGEHNSVYVEYSLRVLCRYLRLTENYRPLLRNWMRMKTDEGVRRLTAISLAPEYFRDFDDPDLGRYLVDVLCDLQDDCRRAVRDALVTMLGMSNEVNLLPGLAFDEWDEETTSIVQAALLRFDYAGWKISHGRTVN